MEKETISEEQYKEGDIVSHKGMARRVMRVDGDTLHLKPKTKSSYPEKVHKDKVKPFSSANEEVDEKVEETDETLEETAAADTLETKGMNKAVDLLQAALAIMNSKEFGKNIPDDAAAKNAATVQMKGDAASAVMPNLGQAVKEELSTLFGSQELSEDFQDKASTLFEAALHAKVSVIQAELEEQHEQRLAEELETLNETLVDQVDHYISYVAEEWVKENQLAIEASIRTEMTESFMEGLKELFVEHYIDIPDEKLDIVEALAEKVEELEDDLNEQVNSNIELVEMLKEYNKQDIFNEVAEGLALTQIDKFKTLAESVDFDLDDDAFRQKLETIKESYFSVKTKQTQLFEEVDIADADDEDSDPSDPQMMSYAKAISRSIKK